MLTLTEQDISQRITMARAIEVLEQVAGYAAAGSAHNMVRQRLGMSERMLHILPAGSEVLGHLGIKAYLTGGTRKDFWYMLFDLDGLKALLSADQLGRIRTGAASGLATKLLARPDAHRLGIIGAGAQAFTQIEAIAQVRRLSHVFVHSRSVEKCDVLVQKVRDRLALPITVVTTARDAVVNADILVTITSAREAVIEGSWIQPGTHINAVGSNKATHRELDDETVRRSEQIVVEDLEQAKVEAGEFLRTENFDWSRVTLLSQLVGQHNVRHAPEAITLFKSLGIGLWDLALAVEVVQSLNNLS